MKFKKILLGFSPFIVAAAEITTTLTSCGNKAQLPQINEHTIVNALINLLVRPQSGSPYYTTSKAGAVEVHHFNNSSIGYIDVDAYVSARMNFELLDGPKGNIFTSKTKDCKTIITNPGNKATCTIDYVNQTLTFSDYDAFISFNSEFATNPFAYGAHGGEPYFVRNEEDNTVLWDSKYVCGGQLVIDMKKYNIVLYYYENKGYIPYDLFRDIILCATDYTMFYNGVNFYEVDGQNNLDTVNLYSKIREEATILDQEYMNYCYNLLALTLDTRFGLPERPSRVNPGTTIKYFPNGAYAALEPYKEGLTSLKSDLANDYLTQFFADCVDDGGHAGYSGLDLLCTRPHERVRGPEATNTFNIRDKVDVARSAYYKTKNDPVAPSDYWAEKPESERPAVTDNYVKVYGEGEQEDEYPILYITFDQFRSADYKINYQSVNETNYTNDTISMTMYADKFIKKWNTDHTEDKKKIKNVVIDLTRNGGGAVDVGCFLSSWLCGGSTQTLWNPITKSYGRFTIKADVNGDGDFTSEDYLPSTTNLICITSQFSFSCANFLPCNVLDNRKNKTYFVGDTSGGGACFVDADLHYGLGNVYRSSATFHDISNASTLGNPISLESGCQPDSWLLRIPAESPDYSGYVNRIKINTLIRGIL